MLKAKHERTGIKPCPMYASRLEGLDQSIATGAITGFPGEEGALVKSAMVGKSVPGESFVKLELRCKNLNVKEHTIALH